MSGTPPLVPGPDNPVAERRMKKRQKDREKNYESIKINKKLTKGIGRNMK